MKRIPQLHSTDLHTFGIGGLILMERYSSPDRSFFITEFDPETRIAHGLSVTISEGIPVAGSLNLAEVEAQRDAAGNRVWLRDGMFTPERAYRVFPSWFHAADRLTRLEHRALESGYERWRQLASTPVLIVDPATVEQRDRLWSQVHSRASRYGLTVRADVSARFRKCGARDRSDFVDGDLAAARGVSG